MIECIVPIDSVFHTINKIKSRQKDSFFYFASALCIILLTDRPNQYFIGTKENIFMQLKAKITLQTSPNS